MLILFDIDATLLLSNRAGVRAMVQAGRELVGEQFSSEGVMFSGGLDPSLIALMLERHDRPSDPQAVERFRALYARLLRRLLDDAPGTCKLLPGAGALVRAVAARAKEDARVVPGLLTGNFPETGAMKIVDAGLEMDLFQVCVWGCDSPHHPPLRSHLPPVAMRLYRERTGRAIDAERTVVIGDTPHDVSCALAHGCRCLAVATGKHSEEELRACGAHRVVADLSDTESELRWIFG